MNWRLVENMAAQDRQQNAATAQGQRNDLLDARAAGVVRTRAKSARDLYVAEHPEITETTNAKLKADGISALGDVMMAHNKARSEAIAAAKADGSYAAYEERARQLKEAAATDRTAGAADEDDNLDASESQRQESKNLSPA